MHARALAATVAVVALPTAVPAAHAASVGDVTATVAGGAIGVQDGAGGREQGFVALLDGQGAVARRTLSPANPPTSAPGLSRLPDGRVVVAWRNGHVVRPAQAPTPPPPEGIFSGLLDPFADEPAPLVQGGLRDLAVPDDVQVAARGDGGHVLVWLDSGGSGVRALAVAPDGTPGRVRPLGTTLGQPLVATSRRHVWVGLSPSSGTMRLIRLTRAAGVAADFAIEPEGDDGPFRALALSGDGRGGAIALSVHEDRGRRVLATTQVTGRTAYGQNIARAGRRHDFAAHAGVVRGRAVFAYTDSRGASRARLGPPRRDLLERPPRALRLGAGERVEDLAGSGPLLAVLVRGRSGMALRRLTFRDGRLRASRAVDLSRSARGQRDGRVDLHHDGRAYAAWEQVVRPGCVAVNAAAVTGRRARSAAITTC